MLSRIVFLLIALFWVMMNVLLWRFEYGSQEAAGSPVDAQVVWQKMLTAPDNSSLTILRHGQRVGFCRWSTAVAEEMAEMDEAPSAGSPEKSRRYRLRLDGDFSLPESKDHLRFESSLSLSNRTDWSEFNLRIRMPPVVLVLRSRAVEQTLRFSLTNADDRVEQTFSFAELQNPQSLLGLMAGPAGGGLLQRLDVPAAPSTATQRLPAIKWEARFDTIYIAHAPVRVYRLQAQIMNGVGIVLYISRAGEIFKAELPDGLVLLHDRLMNL